MKSRGRLAAVIFSVILIVYFPSFFNTFVWDDEQFIVRNVYTTSLKYIPEIFTTNTIAGAGEVSNYYRPLTTLSFVIDRLIWGLRPFGFHLTNTVVHAASAVLIFLFLKRLKLPDLPSFFIALLFGLHPLQTEAVTYINSRGDSLYVFWLLLSLLSFTYVVKNQTLSRLIADWQIHLSVPQLMGLTVITFIFSFLSKEIGLAGLGLLMGVGGLLGSKSHWRLPGLTILGAGLSILMYLGLRLTVLNFANSLNFYGEQNLYTQFLHVRLLTFMRTLGTYFQLLWVPYPLHMERSQELITHWLDPGVLAIVGLIIGFLSLGYWEWRHHRTTWIWFGSWWFACLMAPVSGVVPINGLVYEHWLYLPMVGVWIVMWRVISLLIPARWMPFFRRLGIGAMISWLIVLSALTIRQNWLWRHPIPFYSYTLQYAQSARLYNNLAMAYSDAGQEDQALEYYQRALTQYGDNYPQIHHNMGQSYRALGQLDQAKAAYRRALEVSPNFEVSYLPLIDILREEGSYQEALPLIQEMVRRHPSGVEFLLLEGEALAKLGDLTAAEIRWQKAYRLSGFNPEVQAIIQAWQREAQPDDTHQQTSVQR